MDHIAEDKTPYDNDLTYLEEELNWMEQRVRRLAAEKKLAALQSDEDDDRWERNPASPAQLRRAAREHGCIEEQMRARIDQRLAVTRERAPVALDKICELYGLSADERVVLLIGAAPTFGHKFTELFEKLGGAFCAGNSVEVLFSFLGYGFRERITQRSMLRADAPLLANDLITLDLGRRVANPEDLLVATVQITSRTLSFMVGDALPPDEMLEWSSVEEPMATMGQVVLADRDKQRILSVVEHHDEYLRCRSEWGFDEVIRYGKGILMLFHGKPGTGKTLTAHAVAHHLGKRVLNVDIPTFLESRETERFLPGLFREARLQDAVLFFDECESLFESRRYGNHLMTMLLTEIERFEGVAILATNLPDKLDEALDRRILVKVRFPEPDRDARMEIWRRHLPDAAPLSDDVDLEQLASRHEITGGYIKNAVLMALAEAVHAGGEQPSITMAHLEQACREQMRPFDEDGEPLVVPKVRLADVILPPRVRETVDEIIDAARDRRTVLERWGIGDHLTYGKGIVALFHGAPGTGKTLTAEAIACELNRPLLARSFAGLLSKWVGGSERNVERLFSDAKSQNAVLFLDEVDGLLGARKVDNQNHVNRLVNQLLTQLERHDGLVLLATNLPDHLDPALLRRLSWRVGFPMPGPEERTEIWRRLIPETVPTDAELSFGRLGSRHELSGAEIRNAVFRAAFRAAHGDGVVTMALLERAAREEAGVETVVVGMGGEAGVA